MTESTKIILKILSTYLEENPDIRFGQALFNLGINVFASELHPEDFDFMLRDIYNDSSETILQRIPEHVFNKFL